MIRILQYIQLKGKGLLQISLIAIFIYKNCITQPGKRG